MDLGSVPRVCPYDEVDSRLDLDETMRGMLLAHRFGAYGAELARLRRGEPVSDPGFAAFEAFLDTNCEPLNIWAYRGLAALDVAALENCDGTCLHHEPAPSSWSVYPSVALRIALSHLPAEVQDPHIWIVRCRLLPTNKAFYIGGDEFEILRPRPLTLQILSVLSENVNFLSARIRVSLADAVTVDDVND